jgi:hypothetical protein
MNIVRYEDQSQIARAFKESGMFPDLKSEAQAIVKIQAGAELGVEPFAAMTGIDIVQGKPRMNANLQAGLIKRSGRYNYKVIEHTDSNCKLEFYERWGEQWQSIGVSEFSIKEAQQAGLANKDNWKKHPKNMLFARAISNAAKWYCADIFIAGAYNESDEFEHHPVVSVDTSGIDRLKASVVISEVVEPPVISVVEPEPVAEPTPMMIVDEEVPPVVELSELDAALEMLEAAETLEELISAKDGVKECFPGLTAGQLAMIKARFSARQKEVKK